MGSTAIILKPSTMARAALPVIALAVWTLLVWANRIRNIVANDSLSGSTLFWRLTTAVLFVGAGLLLTVALIWYVRTRHPFALPVITWIGVSLAVIGTMFWVIRGTLIAFGEYDMGFKVIHSVLAVVSVVLGGIVVWWAGLIEDAT
ncbi:MAG: hypothetical protein AAGD35_02505 [Actinomycetota bacterium]